MSIVLLKRASGLNWAFTCFLAPRFPFQVGNLGLHWTHQKVSSLSLSQIMFVVCACVCPGAYVQVRGQPGRAVSLLLLCGPQELNSDCQMWQHAHGAILLAQVPRLCYTCQLYMCTVTFLHAWSKTSLFPGFRALSLQACWSVRLQKKH